MAPSVGDYNNDGWPDMLVTCFGGVVLYRNNGNGTFTDVTKAAGLAGDTGWAMGAAFGDYDGDGLHGPVRLPLRRLRSARPAGLRLDGELHVPHHQGPVRSRRAERIARQSLSQQRRRDVYRVSKQAGVDDPQNLLGLTAVWSDFDNDGKLELFVANDGAQNYLYRNDGKGRFTEIGYEAGVALDENGKALANMGVALGDYLHTGLLVDRHHAFQRAVPAAVPQ